MGKGTAWPLEWKEELWELLNTSGKKGTITSQLAWEFKSRRPELTEQAILSMARRLMKYADIQELRAGEGEAKRPPLWSKEEDEALLEATRELGTDEVRLTPVFSRLAKTFDRPPAAVRRRWSKLTTKPKTENSGPREKELDILQKLQLGMEQNGKLKEDIRRLQLALKQIGDMVTIALGNGLAENSKKTNK
ncbi:MAG: hypothetical protein HPY50_17435 [Firmicutes bacterium]|nr:hypothetical protein [Bacillota bacterium]